jgi:hypothetical protein
MPNIKIASFCTSIRGVKKSGELRRKEGIDLLNNEEWR